MNTDSCRLCGTLLLADGEGGWTCPRCDRHNAATKFPELPETHMQGNITLENLPATSALVGDLGIQIAGDGRVWICVNGIALLRFSPHPNGRMRKTYAYQSTGDDPISHG
jgi:phage FluMu protein Com